MYKIPTCKLCGQKGHWKYQCFQNPKRSQAIKKKMNEMRMGKTPKRDKVLSSQSLNRKRLIVELDRYCSLITRIKASDKNGVVTCFTCGRRLPWKATDCGHYVSRQKMQSRFDFANLRPQCQNCNRVLRGNLEIYRKRLINEIGRDAVEELENRPPMKIMTAELESLLGLLKLEYKRLVEEKKSKENSSLL